ncbi:hypothetical protein ACFLTH_05550 [Bacteroidota bacterium]
MKSGISTETLTGESISDLAEELIKLIKEKYPDAQDLTGCFKRARIKTLPDGEKNLVMEPYERNVNATNYGVETLLSELEKSVVLKIKYRNYPLDTKPKPEKIVFYDPKLEIKVDEEISFASSVVRNKIDSEDYQYEVLMHEFIETARYLTKPFPKIRKLFARALRNTKSKIESMNKKPFYLVLETYK